MKIILASASPQRRKIMDILGIPYTIIPSTAQEKTVITTTVAALVKENALLKAGEVAARVKRGLVIGADTVVFSHQGRLILKPKDLKEARKNLKELMAKPHWVYTGVAVIDTLSGKTVAIVEKTKVFMDKLSDPSIARYHHLVNPLDKAGGFDIEGKGAIFIPRIEGCYFNVVGLPVSALVKILNKFGVNIL